MCQFVLVFFALFSASFSSFSHESIQFYIVLVLFGIFTGRIAAKRQTAGIKFTHMPKIMFFFVPQGRIVAPIQVKLCRTDGHLGLLGCAKFHLNQCRGVGMRPQNIKKFPLFARIAPQERLPWPISKIFRGFYMRNYTVSYISVSNFM